MKMPSANAASADVPMTVIVARLAQEIDHIAGQLRDVDEALGALLMSNQALDAKTFQQVDFIRQEMEGLKSFLHALAVTIGPDGSGDPLVATHDLRLRAQQSRLRGDMPAIDDTAGRDASESFLMDDC